MGTARSPEVAQLPLGLEVVEAEECWMKMGPLHSWDWQFGLAVCLEAAALAALESEAVEGEECWTVVVEME